MKNLEIYDVVALTVDLPKENLLCGQVGTIVEVYNNGEAFEIDFVDRREGFTYALLTLRPEQLMRLYHEPIKEVAV